MQFYPPFSSAYTNSNLERQRLSPSSHRASDARYDARLPPTPPLRPGSGSGLHSRHSHSPIESLSKGGATEQASASHLHRSSVSSNGSTHLPTNGPYASPAPSVSSYSSPIDAPSSSASMYYARAPTTTTTYAPGPTPPTTTQPAPHKPTQQPHHQTTPPTSTPSTTNTSTNSLITPVTPAWQHHHYFPPSTTTPYPQNQDRYICRTCHKAFSRPSSLRIHSHSHTGEKPFRCTHAGCGKAFSVRSNMKRHERGCHSGRPAVPAATALVS